MDSKSPNDIERDGTREGSHVVGAIGNMLSCFHGTLRVGR